MRYVIVLMLTFGMTFSGYSQKNIISISRTAFYYYDNTPMNTSSTLIPFNISYERKFSNGIALKAKYGWYRPYYGVDEGSVEENTESLIQERRFSNYSVGVKKYFRLVDQLDLYPTLNITYRRGLETHYLLRDISAETIYKPANLNAFGVGVGVGVIYTIMETGVIGLEIMHREFTHKEEDSVLYEDPRYENIGSKHQLSIEFFVGITF